MRASAGRGSPRGDMALLRKLSGKQGVRVILGLLILLVFALHAVRVLELDFMARLENFAYDTRLLLTMPRSVDDRIVIVDIDERSLAREGRWPWSRKKMARLMDRLFVSYQAYVVGFDVVFAESEEASGLEVIKILENSPLARSREFEKQVMALKRSFDHDRMFAESLDGRNVVLGMFFADADESGEVPRAGVLPPPALTLDDFAGRDIPFVESAGYAGNLPEFQANASAAGHLMNQPDSDGVVRRVPMLHRHGNELFPALSLAVARLALNVSRIRPGFPSSGAGDGYAGMEWLSLDGVRIPVDESVQALVPYRGGKGSFPYVSAKIGRAHV